MRNGRVRKGRVGSGRGRKGLVRYDRHGSEEKRVNHFVLREININTTTTTYDDVSE